jgi:AcrR family transcriptional regulator
MRRLAERLGIQAPSLYKHVSGKDELEDALIAEGLEELGAAVVRAAGVGESLRSMAQAYRTFARERPNLYRLLTERPLPRDHRPGPREAEAIRLLAEATGGRDRARAAWAFVHGMSQLELVDRFPPGADVEAAWEAGLAAFGGVGDAPVAVPERTSEPERARPDGARPRTIVRSWHGPD